MSERLKVGDRVRLTPEAIRYHPWPDRRDGLITRVIGNRDGIHESHMVVRWPSGEEYTYLPNDLELMPNGLDEILKLA